MLNRLTPSAWHFRHRHRRIRPVANNQKLRLKLTSRPKPERIGDESLTASFSPFVHGHIWWRNSVHALYAYRRSAPRSALSIGINLSEAGFISR